MEENLDQDDLAEVEVCFKGSVFSLYRGKVLGSQEPVFLKLANQGPDYPLAQAFLDHEYQLCQANGAVPHRLEPMGRLNFFDDCGYVYRRCPGVPLAHLMGQLPMNDTLALIVKLAEAVRDFHDRSLILKVMHPETIYVQREPWQVTFLDFSQAVKGSDGCVPSQTVLRLGRDYRHAAPEQSPHMFRQLDSRTDLYTLGMLFFRLLTGRPVFSDGDAVELVHATMAQAASFSCEADSAIPQQVQAVVLRLLEKMPEKRYQTAGGLLVDLEECWRQFWQKGLVAPFELGSRDTIQDISLLHLGYFGRSNEISQLLDCFSKVLLGEQRVSVLYGEVGSGKTRCVRELSRPVFAEHGYWVTGVCPPDQANKPYLPFNESLGQLLTMIMGEPESRVGKIADRVRAALGEHCETLTAVVPDLAKLLGTSEERRGLQAKLTPKLYLRLYVKFIQSLCSQNYPVLLYIDDLHWIDQASAHLLRELVKSPKTRYLYLVCSYAESEVAAGSPAAGVIEFLQTRPKNTLWIPLGPLDQRAIRALLQPIFKNDEAAVQPLTKTLADKTGGNPLYLEQFLRQMFVNRYVVWNVQAGRWSVDQTAIASMKATTNVVNILIADMDKLSAREIKLLEGASCIGGEFSLGIVHRVLKGNLETTARDATTLLEKGFLCPLEHTKTCLDLGLYQDCSRLKFRFAHEKLYRAIRARVQGFALHRYHLDIAQELEKDLKVKDDPELLYDTVFHFQRALTILTREQRILLARLSLQACQQTATIGAFEAALGHARTGISALPDNSWRSLYDLSLQLFTEGARCAFVLGDSKELEGCKKVIMARAKCLHDKLPVYDILIQKAFARRRLVKGFRLANEAFAELGSRYTRKPRHLRILWQLWRLEKRLGRHFQDRVLSFSSGRDQDLLARASLLRVLHSYCAHEYPGLIALIACDNVRLGLRKEKIVGLSYGVVCLCVQLVRYLGRERFGYALARRVLELTRHTDMRENLNAAEQIYVANLMHWREPLRATVQRMKERFHRTGEEVHSADSTALEATRFLHEFFSGTDLEQLEKSLKRSSQLTKEEGKSPAQFLLRALHKTASELTNHEVADFTVHSNAAITAKKSLQPQSRWDQAVAGIMAMVLSSYDGDDGMVLQAAKRTHPCLPIVRTSYLYPVYHFYLGLSLLRTQGQQSWPRRWWQRRQIQGVIRKFRRWADLCPKNHSNKYHLLVAIDHCRAQRHRTALHHFELAIRKGMQNGFYGEAGLACEYFGHYYRQDGFLELATHYFTKGRAAYHKWGAHRKVRQLELSLPSYLPAQQEQAPTVDFITLRRALKTIAEQPSHWAMMEKITRYATKYCGAQRAVLVLARRKAGLYVELDYQVSRKNGSGYVGKPLQQYRELPQSLCQYIKRTQKRVLLADCRLTSESSDNDFIKTDDYVVQHRPKSIVGVPIISPVDGSGSLLGLLYLENKLTTNAFSKDQLDLLEIITLCAAGRLELALKAATDGLTGLYNHESFKSMLKREIAECQRKPKDLSILMIDIDHFKQFNDTHGHQAGDEVLKSVASAIQRVCRRSDVVARYGGEEMSVILHGAKVVNACEVGERVRNAIEREIVSLGKDDQTVTASIGVASFSKSTLSSEHLIKRADLALYESKRKGRNRVSICN